MLRTRPCKASRVKCRSSGTGTSLSSAISSTSATHSPCLSCSLRWTRKRCVPTQPIIIRPGCGRSNFVMRASVPTGKKASWAKPSPVGLPLPSSGARRALVAAFAQAHHAERFAGLVAAADHVEVTHLEDAQRQRAAGEQHALQREQRQLREGGKRQAHESMLSGRRWPCGTRGLAQRAPTGAAPVCQTRPSVTPAAARSCTKASLRR